MIEDRLAALQVIEAVAEPLRGGGARAQRTLQLSLQLGQPVVSQTLRRAHDRRTTRTDGNSDLRSRHEQDLVAVIGKEPRDVALARRKTCRGDALVDRVGRGACGAACAFGWAHDQTVTTPATHRSPWIR